MSGGKILLKIFFSEGKNYKHLQKLFKLEFYSPTMDY